MNLSLDTKNTGKPMRKCAWIIKAAWIKNK